jgi:hypothetical protein
MLAIEYKCMYSYLKFNFITRIELIRGTEVPVMVIFTTAMEGHHNEELFSRCTSSLIVVCNAEDAVKFVGPNEKCECAYTIPVHGKFFCLS